MTTKPNEPEALEPCPFCGAPLFFNGNKMNPYGRCETEGCWMHDRKCTVPTDDPWQVGQWNRRVHAHPVADAGGVTEDDVIGLINIVTDLAEVDALDKAYPEVWGRLDAMVNHAVADATAAKDAAIRARDDHFRNAQRLADKLVAKEAKIARLREALERIQPVACGDWCRDDKHIPECENALAALSEAREAGDSLAAGDRV